MFCIECFSSSSGARLMVHSKGASVDTWISEDDVNSLQVLISVPNCSASSPEKIVCVESVWGIYIFLIFTYTCVFSKVRFR